MDVAQSSSTVEATRRRSVASVVGFVLAGGPLRPQLCALLRRVNRHAQSCSASGSGLLAEWVTLVHR